MPDAYLVLSDELETSMRLLGVTDVNQLRPHMVNTRELDSFIMSEIPDLDSSIMGRIAGFTSSKAKL